MTLDANHPDSLRRLKARQEFDELVLEVLPYSDSDVKNDQERIELAQARARWILLRKNWMAAHNHAE